MDLAMNDYDRSAQLFKILMHPARLAILDVLRNGEACVCHIEAALSYRQAYISQQLAALREAGLIQDRREGWNIYYRVTRPQVFEIIDAALRLNGTHRISRVKSMKSASPDNCPCPKCNPTSELKAVKIQN
jgi:DNA-binding transcriptional ArsR family regulator